MNEFAFEISPLEVILLRDGNFLCRTPGEIAAIADVEPTCRHCGSGELEMRYMEEERREIPWCGRCAGRAD